MTMNKVATLLLCACFITVLFPQPGYIHPDEFFQSSEIVAGDILEVIHTRAWEFNSSFPVRSVVIPYLLMSPSLQLLHWMNSTSFSGFKISAVKVVMATRLPVAFLNIFGYLATGNLASHFGVERSLSTVLWCSSYVFWSYFTRTFSNSIESFLLALVFLLTVTFIPAPQGKTKSKEESLHKEKGQKYASMEKVPHGDKNDSSEKIKSSTIEATPVIRKFSSEENDPMLKMKSVLLGMLISAGFFNRPTFLLFTFIPIFYWCLSQQRNRAFIDRLAVFITIKFYALIGIVLVFAVFITADTLYYNEDFQYVVSRVFHNIAANPFSTGNVIKNIEVLFSSLVITPWNFLKYNIDSSNLAQHGLHPRYTHFLINLPLLIGPLYIPFVAVCISSLFLSMKRNMKGNVMWLVAMTLVPIFGLSIFPHQEPRFLIPLLPVLIVTSVRIVSAMTIGRRAFFIMWVIFNVTLHLVYGYLHQAALIPALSLYQQRLSASSLPHSKQTHFKEHMIFYKTYPPPLHLLLLHESRSEVEVHDLAGSQFKVLMKLVSGIERDIQKRKIKTRMYIFLPSTVSPRFLDLLAEIESDVSSSSICPHLSTESLPRFKGFWRKGITFDEFLMDFCLNIVQVSAKD